jgi:hypothetical protein
VPHGSGRARAARAACGPARPNSSRATELQAKIERAEQERLGLERRVADAFTRGDHGAGTRAAGELERLKPRIDRMYREWLEAEGGDSER